MNTSTISAAFLVLHIVVATIACVHILLTKENVRSSVGWMGLVILSPLLGAMIYWVFGINRIRRRFAESVTSSFATQERMAVSETLPLVNGDEAFPIMLDAIAQAKHCIALSTYIFDADESGLQFVDALADAHARGVDVRVLVDAVGIRYSRQPIDQLLIARGVRTARFLPVRTLGLLEYINLRSHRKLLLVDGTTAFIGGMNIRHGNCVQANPPEPVQDVHFRVRGPVVGPLSRVFEEDWEFAAHEVIQLPRPAEIDNVNVAIDPTNLNPPINGTARVIADGPDDGEDRLQWVFLSALCTAQKRVRIVTPYFLPNETLISGIEVAVTKGVVVEVIVPRENNLFYMNWAMSSVFTTFVKRGVHVYVSDPPFDHSKLFLVDDDWCSIGSSNWDDRSIRLNFELNLEIHDGTLTSALHRLVDAKRDKARRITMGELQALSLFHRIRSSFVRLFAPYL
ncbi:MAG: phospholipase D-like domain-containing protein [Gemmatimonadaceae bacterium]